MLKKLETDGDWISRPITLWYTMVSDLHMEEPVDNVV